MAEGKPKRAFEEIRIPDPKFTGEQDGPYEREFKTKLRELFGAEATIRRAYLATVELGESARTGVMLCLSAQGSPDERLIAAIGSAFASIFDAAQSLDILYVTSVEEQRLAEVCRPFFAQQPGTA
jgi:hypothetical protein